MVLKNIFVNDIKRWYRALVVANAPAPVNGFATYGHQIDSNVKLITDSLSEDAKGYKIEDRGVLVGVYIVDYLNGVQYLRAQLLRPVYTINEMIAINSQVNQWVQQDYLLA